MEHTPVHCVNVVSRTTQAVDYRHHSGGTSIDFRGTDLMPEAEGHARVESRTGRIEINTDLDHQNRANSVRGFLEQQGVKPTNIDARGFGQTQPVASNSTSAGRQLNRRVDLVVTGEAIGATLSR